MRHTPHPLLLTGSTALLALLAACGGIGPGEEVANSVAEATVCGLRNCTESSALQVGDISPRMTATQSDGEVRVSVQLGHSANAFTVVRPDKGDSLSAGLAGERRQPMANQDGWRLQYDAELATTAERPEVVVSFNRAGTDHLARVTLPPKFVIQEPVGEASLQRGGAGLRVRLSLPADTTATARADTGQCWRVDGSSFVLKDLSLPSTREAPGTSRYLLDPTQLDLALDQYGRPPGPDGALVSALSRCEFTLAWTVETLGSLDPAFNRHGYIVGRRQAKQRLVFDARR